MLPPWRRRHWLCPPPHDVSRHTVLMSLHGSRLSPTLSHLHLPFPHLQARRCPSCCPPSPSCPTRPTPTQTISRCGQRLHGLLILLWLSCGTAPRGCHAHRRACDPLQHVDHCVPRAMFVVTGATGCKHRLTPVLPALAGTCRGPSCWWWCRRASWACRYVAAACVEEERGSSLRGGACTDGVLLTE